MKAPPKARWSLRRSRAWLVAAALDRRAAPILVATLIAAYVVLWTLTLALLKWPYDLHGDSVEAYEWGRVLRLDYVKHPPLSAWIARLWFSIFPTTAWAMYALAMTVNGATIALASVLARRIMDPRRAIFVVLLLMVFPILNLKGDKYNPDLLQLPLFLLVAWTFVAAFETRRLGWAIALGLAGAAAVLTKYWALLALGAVGLAALAHPQRLRFFRSPVPYVAAGVFAFAMAAHVIMLAGSDFAPLRHASSYVYGSRPQAAFFAAKAVGHHLALMLPMLAVLLLTLPRLVVSATQAQSASDAARHVWVIAATLLLLPPLLAIALNVQMKSDWGIPLYTLVPVAVVALPWLRVPRRSLPRAAICAGVFALGALLVAPLYVLLRFEGERMQRTALAREVAEVATKLWHARHGSALPAVAGGLGIASQVAFHSADHPRGVPDVSARFAPWIDLDDVGRSGFLGLCRPGKPYCQQDMQTWGRNPERVEFSVERTPYGLLRQQQHWIAFIQAPARAPVRQQALVPEAEWAALKSRLASIFASTPVQALRSVRIGDLQTVMRGGAEIGLSQSILTADANAAQALLPTGQAKLCNLASLHQKFFQIAVRPEAGIASVAGLRGRHLTTQVPGSVGERTVRDLLEVNGLSVADVKVTSTSFTDSILMVQDGHAQAFALGDDAPSVALLDLARARKIELLDLSDSIEAMRARNPAFTAAVIPPAIALRRDRPTRTLGYHSHVVIGCMVPEDVAYILAKVLAENGPALQANLPPLRDADLAAEIGVPFHPGAWRYYRDQASKEAGGAPAIPK